MARLILGVVFAIIGFVISGFNPMGAAIGFAIGAGIGGYVDPTIVKVEGPRMNDLQIVANTYASPIPLLYGSARLPGQMIWTNGIKETRRVKKKRGKGGTVTKSTSYTYSSDFATSFCQGPITNFVKIWADGKLIFDATASVPVNNHFTYAYDFYYGLKTQGQAPPIVAAKGVTNTPAYRDLAYMTFEGFNLADFGNRVPQLTALASNSSQGVINILDGPQQTSFGEALDDGTALVDWNRGKVYTWFDATDIAMDPSEAGMSVWNMITGALIEEVSYIRMFGSVANVPFDYLGNSQPYLERNADVWFWNPAVQNGATQYLVRLNAATHRAKGVYGPFQANSMGGVQTVHDPLGGESATFVFGKGLVDTPAVDHPIGVGIQIIRIDTDSYDDAFVCGGSDPLPSTGDSLKGLACTGYNDGEDAEFWLAVAPKNIASPILGGVTRIWKYAVDVNTVDVDAAIQEASEINHDTIDPIHPIQLASMAYDEFDDSLILTYSRGWMVKWKDGRGIVWTYNRGLPFYEGPFQQITGDHVLDYRATVSNGELIVTTHQFTVNPVFPGQPDVYLSVLDTVRGVVKRNYDFSFDGWWWNSASQSFINGGDPQRIFLNKISTVQYPVADILKDLCRRARIFPSQVDAHDVTSKVTGFVVNRPTTAKASLDLLGASFSFTGVESDGIMKFTTKDRPPILTIPQKWLKSSGGGDGKESDDDDLWKQVRIQDFDLPRRIRVTYFNVEADYVAGAQEAQRSAFPYPSMWSNTDVTLELSMSLTDTEARTIASRLLYNTWVARDRYKTILPWRYLALDPGDPVQVEMDDGQLYRVRLNQADLGADLTIQVDAMAEEQNVYGVSVEGANSDGFVPQTIPSNIPGQLFLMNMPLLQDQDEVSTVSTRVYYGVGATDASWLGGLIQSSADAIDYTDYDVISDDVIWGTVAGTLTDVVSGPWLLDDTTQLIVTLAASGGTLSSTTESGLATGSNAALVGREIIQFKTATLSSGTTYLLTNLLRGRRGTEWTMDRHTGGETFILLEVGTLSTTKALFSEVGVSKSYRLVDTGSLSDAVTPFYHTWLGYDKMPYSPTHFVRTTAGADVLLTWTRRTRLRGGFSVTSGEIPNYEGIEQYEIYILAAEYDYLTFDPMNTASYRRKFTTSTPTLTYTGAMMTADGFSPAFDTLYLVGFQISSLIGRGFPGHAELGGTSPPLPLNTLSARATLTGVTTLTAVATGGTSFATAQLTGYGTVTAAPSMSYAISTTLTGQGSLTSTPHGVWYTTATLTGVSSLTAIAKLNQAAISTLTGVGTLTAVRTGGKWYTSATLTGVATIQVTPAANVKLTTTLQGVTTFTSAARRDVNLTMTLQGDATFTSAARRDVNLTMTLQGDATFTPTPAVNVNLTMTLQGDATFTPTPT